jgi:hypothetical protein
MEKLVHVFAFILSLFSDGIDNFLLNKCIID